MNNDATIQFGTVHNCYDCIEASFFAPFEKNFLNRAGYCVVGALIRCPYGILQVLGAVAVMAYQYFASLADEDFEPDYERLKGYCNHGLANIGRSFIEASVIGAFVLYKVYDGRFRDSYVWERNLKGIGMSRTF